MIQKSLSKFVYLFLRNLNQSTLIKYITFILHLALNQLFKAIELVKQKMELLL